MLAPLLIADDHPTFRKGLTLLIQDYFPGAQVREAANFDEAVEALSENPEIGMVFLDLDMPGMSGGASVAALRAAFPTCRVAIVSGNDSAEVAIEALQSGAHGFLPKSLAEKETVRAISLLGRGESYAPAGLAEAIKSRAERGLRDSDNTSSPILSPRQRDVLMHLGQGKSNKEIARALSLSEGTVKVHLAAVFRALGARNRTEAVLAASKGRL